MESFSNACFGPAREDQKVAIWRWLLRRLSSAHAPKFEEPNTSWSTSIYIPPSQPRLGAPQYPRGFPNTLIVTPITTRPCWLCVSKLQRHTNTQIHYTSVESAQPSDSYSRNDSQRRLTVLQHYSSIVTLQRCRCAKVQRKHSTINAKRAAAANYRTMVHSMWEGRSWNQQGRSKCSPSRRNSACSTKSTKYIHK